MISENQVKSWVLETLQQVKASEAVYKDVVLSDQTIILGSGSPFDSIAFTNFAVSLEEKIDDKTGISFMVNVEDMRLSEGPVTVAKAAKIFTEVLQKSGAAK